MNTSVDMMRRTPCGALRIDLLLSICIGIVLGWGTAKWSVLHSGQSFASQSEGYPKEPSDRSLFTHEQKNYPADSMKASIHSNSGGQQKPNTAKRIFIDLGANCGNSYDRFKSLYIPDLDKFESHLFEPQPDLYTNFLLPRKVTNPRLSVYHGVVGAKDQNVSFYIDTVYNSKSCTTANYPHGASGMFIRKPKDFRKITVRMYDFADFLQRTTQESDHVIVKMDIEGMEWDVLRKIFQRGLACRIDHLWIEYHYDKYYPNLHLQEKFPDFVTWLSKECIQNVTEWKV
jgi:FkbM family methyltransferase